MSNREIVIDLVKRLPDNTPLQDIAREIQFIAGIRKAQEEAARSEGVPAEQLSQLVPRKKTISWTGKCRRL